MTKGTVKSDGARELTFLWSGNASNLTELMSSHFCGVATQVI